MKKLVLIAFLAVFVTAVSAQDSTKTKQHLNEFGIDVTGFLKQYLNIGSTTQFPEPILQPII